MYVTGSFQDTADFDPGPATFNLITNGGTDIFIQKLDAGGNFLWAKSIGGIGFYILLYIRAFQYDKVATLTLVILIAVVLIEQCSVSIRKKLR